MVAATLLFFKDFVCAQTQFFIKKSLPLLLKEKMALSKITFFCVALALLLGGAKSQLLSGDECPPKTGDTFYIGVLGDPIMFMASWIATEHAINNNGLAAKPSIGCFDFDIHVFTGDGPSDEITCYKDPEYRFKTDYDIDAGAFGGVPLEELGCDDLCFPSNSIRYDTNCQASVANLVHMKLLAMQRIMTPISLLLWVLGALAQVLWLLQL